jgi:hypothetical protein
MKAVPGVRYLLPGPTRTARALVGGASETGLLFQGAMVSIMILIPANALSISPCTRLNLRVQNLCSSWSSGAQQNLAFFRPSHPNRIRISGWRGVFTKLEYLIFNKKKSVW